ncbi:MAG: hypothetical protein R3E73_14240 [Porticoccaceae bacterium]|nr:hypothetical protein [Pseudomonadales bacterium]MCP5170916.1 hypothetical protein [Pseudomonadales bacterium]MCP5301844.1 hypothetical protein [Pseudomonadales bacterium]
MYINKAHFFTLHASRHLSIKSSAKFIVAALLLSTTHFAHAEGLFLPNDFVGSANPHSPIDKKLSNDELAERAAELRDQRLSITQRTLNHQWLSQHQDNDAIEGGKAFSQLFKRGFKKYWDRKRETDFADKDYVPDSNGGGRVNEMDYKVRVSSDTINFGLTYEF